MQVMFWVVDGGIPDIYDSMLVLTCQLLVKQVMRITASIILIHISLDSKIPVRELVLVSTGF